eukprot:4577503-Amphidinium_carterae.3
MSRSTSLSSLCQTGLSGRTTISNRLCSSKLLEACKHKLSGFVFAVLTRVLMCVWVRYVTLTEKIAHGPQSHCQNKR